MVFYALWFCIVLTSGFIDGATALFCNVHPGRCIEQLFYCSIRNAFFSWQQSGTSRRPEDARGTMYSHATLFERIRTNWLLFCLGIACCFCCMHFCSCGLCGFACVVRGLQLQSVLWFFSKCAALGSASFSIALRPVSHTLVDRVWVRL